MAVGDIGFTIVPKVDATKGSASLKKLQEQFGDLNKRVEKLKATNEKSSKAIDAAFKRNSSAAMQFGMAVASGAGMATRALMGLPSVVSRVAHSLVNIKTLIGGTLLGAAALKAAHALFEQGLGNQRSERRVSRQFDAATAGQIRAAAGGMYRYGVGDDDAANALVPIAEAVQSTQAGTKYRGRTLTAEQAARVRAETFERGRNLLQRAAVFNPDIDPETLGLKIAEAGTDPKGINALAKMLHLDKRAAAQLVKQNESGKLFQHLRPGEAAEFGIGKGEKAGTGALMDLFLSRSGMRTSDAEKETHRFEIQVKSLSSLFANKVGDIGAKALDKINDKLGEGSTLAEKLAKWFDSDKGTQFIDKIGDRVAGIVDGLLSLIDKLPALLESLSAKWPDALKSVEKYGNAISVIADSVNAVDRVVSKMSGGKGDPPPRKHVDSPGISAAENPTFNSQQADRFKQIRATKGEWAAIKDRIVGLAGMEQEDVLPAGAGVSSSPRGGFVVNGMSIVNGQPMTGAEWAERYGDHLITYVARELDRASAGGAAPVSP